MGSDTEDPPIILNDLLTYVHCKMTVCPKDTLISALLNFYPKSEIRASRDQLFNTVPALEDAPRRVKHQESDKMFSSIYVIMQELPSDKPPVFAATNVNNIPAIDLKNIDGINLVYQQDRMRCKMEDMAREHSMMRSELSSVQSLLRDLLENKMPNSTTGSDTKASPEIEQTISECNEHGYISQATRNFEAVRPKTSYATKLRNSRHPEPERVINTSLQGSIDRSRYRPQQRYSESHENRIPDGPTKRSRTTGKVVTGTKTGTSIRVAQTANRCRIFVSRLAPDLDIETVTMYVNGIIDNNCTVYKLKSRLDFYSSFVICCDEKFKTKVMDANEWERGVLIRPYFVKLPEINTQNDQT